MNTPNLLYAHTNMVEGVNMESRFVDTELFWLGKCDLAFLPELLLNKLFNIIRYSVVQGI